MLRKTAARRPSIPPPIPRGGSPWPACLAAIGLAALLGSGLLGGCAAPPEAPDRLIIAPGGYEAAFDAVVQAANEADLHPVVRSRRAGVIETETVTAPSLLEPWRGDISGMDRSIATIALLRRRALFEFTTDEKWTHEPGVERLDGPDVLGVGPARVDRTSFEGPMELRVRVFLEQAHSPGFRPDPWSHRASSYTEIVRPDGEPVPSRFWTPVARDEAMERALRARIQMLLDASHDEAGPAS